MEFLRKTGQTLNSQTRVLKTRNIGECSSICRRDDNCIAFDYSAWTEICRLSNEATVASTDDSDTERVTYECGKTTSLHIKLFKPLF